MKATAKLCPEPAASDRAREIAVLPCTVGFADGTLVPFRQSLLASSHVRRNIMVLTWFAKRHLYVLAYNARN